MARPQGKLKEALKAYVCIRIDDLRGVDIGLFAFDPDITMYSFILNADEQIYLRYGGRDDASAMSYMSEESLLWTLKKGLELHQDHQAGKLPKTNRPKPFFPRQFPSVQRDVIAKNECVHCHHIGSGRTKLSLQRGEFEPLRDVWYYPDIKRLGLEIHPVQGLLIRRVSGSAAEAGMEPGDLVTHVEGKSVISFGDLQETIHQHPIDSDSLKISIERGEETRVLSLRLDEWWRSTHVNRRAVYNALQPFPEFWAKACSSEEKKALGISPESFAAKVTRFWVGTRAKAAGLQIDDVVVSVDGVTQSPYTDHPPTWIRLNRKAGDKITIKAMRGKKELSFSFKLRPRPW